MDFQVTVRHGSRYQRYHTLEVSGEDVRAALRAAAEQLPDEVAEEADLVEIRPAVDPDERSYLGEGEG